MNAKAAVRRLVRRAAGMPPTNADQLRALMDRGHLTMGRRTYGDPAVVAFPNPDGSWVEGNVHIGAFCSIAEGVTIFAGGEHNTQWVTTFPVRVAYQLPGAGHDGHPTTKGDVNIGNDVWIARGATILSGVTIGDGAVIGGGAVVARDVRPYAIVAGNPAREVRRRFDDATVDRLLAMRWWDWPDDKIVSHAAMLCSAPATDVSMA